MSGHEDDTCVELLTVGDLSTENVLSITFTQSAQDRLESWNHRLETHPAKAAILTVGETTRSATATQTESIEIPVPSGGQLDIEAVADPGNLTDLGIRITERIEDWDRDGNQIVVCFHSLTALLQYVDVQRAFRFLHVFTGKMSSVDAVCHFHMDPGAHDEKTINTLKTVFDAVVRLDEDGEITVRTR